MSSGLKAGIEVRETEQSVLNRRHPARLDIWLPIVPAIDVDWVENRLLFKALAGSGIYPGIDAMLMQYIMLLQRGLPNDVTDEIKQRYDEWHGVAFEANWVTLDELCAVIAVPELLHHASIDAIIAFLDAFHERGFDTRLVLWQTPI